MANDVKLMLLRFTSSIADNNKREQEALQGYYDLLSWAISQDVHKIFPDFVADIEEIISDELNHSKKLQGWAEKFAKIKAAKD